MADGSGYPDGLSGDTIPLGARILAVADAFDAMQRPVAYREPMSKHEAASEVVRVKGIQFDPEVVDAFVKVAVRRGLWTGSLRDKLRMPSKVQQPELIVQTEQQTLEEAVTEPGEAAAPRPSGATPADGISYDDVRGEIEKDIREWKRTESGARRRAREPKRKTGSRKKKSEEDKG